MVVHLFPPRLGQCRRDLRVRPSPLGAVCAPRLRVGSVCLPVPTPLGVGALGFHPVPPSPGGSVGMGPPLPLPPACSCWPSAGVHRDICVSTYPGALAPCRVRPLGLGLSPPPLVEPVGRCWGTVGGSVSWLPCLVGPISPPRAWVSLGLVQYLGPAPYSGRAYLLCLWHLLQERFLFFFSSSAFWSLTALFFFFSLMLCFALFSFFFSFLSFFLFLPLLSPPSCGVFAFASFFAGTNCCPCFPFSVRPQAPFAGPPSGSL